MKKEILPSLVLTVASMILLCVVYPGIIWAIAQLSPNKGDGYVIKDVKGKYYYENIGQNFTDDKYFWSRPSAVNYNANGSGGSNKGPDNPDYLILVKGRIDSFMVHNPDVNKANIPADMVTASGSGLDPHISMQGAEIQATRIAKVRSIDKGKIEALIKSHLEKPMYGMGPERINVLKLNLDLDNIK